MGEEKVTIGNNFHSGENVLMITSDHNYDKCNTILHDKMLIHRDVIIGDNVWVGRRVIILSDRRGASPEYF